MAPSESDTIGSSGEREMDKMSPNEVTERLAEYTLEGEWEQVVEMYRNFPDLTHTAKIRDTMGTALHVAIEFNREKVVQDLVKAIVDYINNTKEEEESVVQTKEEEEKLKKKEEESAKSRIGGVLTMRNERGDTPLHVAAARGFTKICMLILEEGEGEGEMRKDLLRQKNNEGETPVFVAALNGSSVAFAYLSKIAGDTLFETRDLVRDNGDSILHCAINREFLDLAVIIVDRYPDLSTLANGEGFTPLKVLATRSSAFRSGTRFSWWKLILYHCILVEPLNVERRRDKLLLEINRQPRPLKFPMNYDTMHEFWERYIKFDPLALLGRRIGENAEKNVYDAEDPPIRSLEGGFLPPNYATFQQFIGSAYVHACGISGVDIKVIREAKEKHIWSLQLLDALMKNPYATYTGIGGKPDWPDDPGVKDSLTEQLGESSSYSGAPAPPQQDTDSAKESLKGSPRRGRGRGRGRGRTKPNGGDKEEEENASSIQKCPQEVNNPDPAKDTANDSEETPLLLAARNGISEMVTKILNKLPSTLHDTNRKKENVLLVSVLNRQPLVVETLKKLTVKEPEVWNNLILAVDKDENTVLHLAAKAQDPEKHKQVAGAALQMMWDTKWFQYAKSIVPEHYCFRVNNEKKTARDIFKITHAELVKDSSEWLKDTSESCSVVAALVAGVSFATATTVPGGNGDNGAPPPLEGTTAFDSFAISSLVGLCFSATGLIMFLTILASRKEARDFLKGLPTKLLLGLSSLFISIAALFVTFYSAHYFNIDHTYKNILIPVYAAASLPVAFFAWVQVPLYWDLIITIFGKVPRARDKGGHL